MGKNIEDMLDDFDRYYYKSIDPGRSSFNHTKNSSVNYQGSFYNINSNKTTRKRFSIDHDTGVFVKVNDVNRATNTSVNFKGLISSILAVFAVIFVIVYACTHTDNVKTEYNVNNELERVYLDMPNFNILSYLEVLESHSSESSTANVLKSLLADFKDYSAELTFPTLSEDASLSDFGDWLGEVISVSFGKFFGFMTGFISLIITVIDTVITLFELIEVVFTWG